MVHLCEKWVPDEMFYIKEWEAPLCIVFPTNFVGADGYSNEIQFSHGEGFKI